jgi:anti-sigma factor RsiW
MLTAKPGGETMEHVDAVQQMAVERYLLDELTPELRDEFEAHAFDCAECSLDLRAGAAFVEEAKLQLPTLASSAPAAAPSRAPRRMDWLAWLRPAYALPAFAALLVVIGYQNIATIPGLRAAARAPRLAPWVSFHTGTRGDAHLAVPAGKTEGAELLIEVPQENNFASYSFDLYDQQGKRFWSKTAAGTQANEMGSGAFSLMIPGAGLRQESYTLVVTGITPQGGRVQVDRRILDVHFDP